MENNVMMVSPEGGLGAGRRPDFFLAVDTGCESNLSGINPCMCLAPVVPSQKACNLGISNLWPEAAKNANAQEVRRDALPTYLATLTLIFSPFSRRAHLHQLWIEPAKDFDEICLRSHDRVDVLIDAGHFIETGGKKLHAALGQQLPGRAPSEGLHRLGTAHQPARAV
jgi:hypothetical protein